MELENGRKDASTGREGVGTMDALMLGQVVGWLALDDALACCCVCVAWNDVLSQRGSIWKSLCHSNRPLFTEAHTSADPRPDFKQLALMMSHRSHVVGVPAWLSGVSALSSHQKS